MNDSISRLRTDAAVAAHTGVLNLVRALDFELNRAYDLVHAHARDPALDPDLDLVRARGLVNDLVNDFVRARDLDPDLVHARALGLHHVLDRARAYAHGLVIDGVIDRAHNLVRGLDQAHSLAMGLCCIRRSHDRGRLER